MKRATGCLPPSLTLEVYRHLKPSFPVSVTPSRGRMDVDGRVVLHDRTGRGKGRNGAVKNGQRMIFCLSREEAHQIKP